MKNYGFKKFFFKTIKIIVVVLAYVFVYMRLRKYDFASAFDSVQNIYFILIAFALMPVNWLLEAYKWRELLSPFVKINIGTSLKAVLCGLPAGIITPARVGEWLGRPACLDGKYRNQGIIATSVGSAIQQVITIITGLIFLFGFIDSKSRHSYVLFAILMLVLIFVFVTLLFLNRDRIDRKPFVYFFDYSTKNLFAAFCLGALRYFVFSSQFVLILLAFVPQTGILELYAVVAIMYLLLNILPVANAFDLGVRSAVSIIVAGFFAIDELKIVFATAIIWIINLVLPTIVGSIMFFRYKKD